MRPTVVVLLLLVVSACAAPSPKPLASGEIALPTDPRIESPEACAGIGVSASLHGDAADSHLAWLVSDDGSRIEVTWPPAYRARFTPRLEVLDANGVVVLKEGDAVSGACVTGDPRVLHLESPFR